MTAPDVPLRDFVMFSASVLVWIVWLACALGYLFGAGMTGGWLAVGILLSLMGIGVILMLKAVLELVEGLCPEQWQVSLSLTKILHLEKRAMIQQVGTTMAAAGGPNARSYRIALGLEPRLPVANRRRTRPLLVSRSFR